MKMHWLLPVVALLAGCSAPAVDEHAPATTPGSLPPAVFPSSQGMPPGSTLEELAESNSDVLQVISSDIVLLQVQHRDVVIELEEGEQDIYVTNLLRGIGKFGGRGRESSGSTLADLQPVSLSANEEVMPDADLEQLAIAYREVLESGTDPDIRLQVQHRLADIELLESEAGMSGSEGDDGQVDFSQSINAYEALLRDNPDNPLNEQVLYQLSKAYAFSGDNASSVALLEQLASVYPESPYMPEVQFRLAESYFAMADYHRADLAFKRAISYGEASPYYLRAMYMHGWALFKQGDYRAAIAPFTATLDQVMPADSNVDALAPTDFEIAQDCLRALAVVFSNLDGAQSLAQTYEQSGGRPYEVLLFTQLGDLYLEQERYRDSAETYKAYAGKFPFSTLAPKFQLRVIEIYEAGGFPELIVQEKKNYVETYAVTGRYWQQNSEEVRSGVRPYLKQFIEELASYYHALAQTEAGKGGQSAVAKEHYLAAGSYYKLFVDSFPGDSNVPAMTFLLGESRFDAQDYPGAISAYEKVAYEFSDYEKAADAAYAAILAYVRLGQGVDGQTDRQRVASEVRFATEFGADPRASGVLEQAAGAMLQSGDYEQAIKLSMRVVDWKPLPGDDIVTSAWLILGHSRFELQQYSDAEHAYRNVLATLQSKDERYATTLDRVAASIYRQGEAAVTAGDHQTAARQFSRVVSAAPQSGIAANAQYDAAISFIQAGELEEGNRLLLDFRSDYPDHELSTSIAASLISNYEQLEQWNAAAIELDGIAGKQPVGEQQRQALYLAASYYDRAGARELALQRYRSYSKIWPQPFTVQMEAMNRLAELYQLNGQSKEQRFWRQEIITAHAQAGTEQSDRSLYLAAFSSSVLANDVYQAFDAIRLHYPIKASLDRKRAAMEHALEAYQNTAAFGVQQFGTLATYRTGLIYQQLGADLVKSERPKNLDELALEQYRILLEEQAYPFEEKAIAIYESNTRRTMDGMYDEWIQKSFTALGELLPVRYHKLEKSIGFSQEIY